VIKPSPNILTIYSRKSELNKVEDFLRDIFQKYSLPERNFNKVLLCVSEAIVNSIVHGNKDNESKEIKIEVKPHNHDIIVTVTDEGEGFDTKTIPDPTQKVNLKKESGRGIHIIKSMCDVLEYNDKGNSIQFLINCK